MTARVSLDSTGSYWRLLFFALCMPIFFFLAGIFVSYSYTGVINDKSKISDLKDAVVKQEKLAKPLNSPAAMPNKDPLQEKTVVPLINQELTISPTVISSAKKVLASHKQQTIKYKNSTKNASPTTTYSVQIALFSNMERAAAWQNSLKSKRIYAKTITKQDADKGLLYPVIIGTYPSQLEAKKVAVEFSRKNKMQAFVTKENPIAPV